MDEWQEKRRRAIVLAHQFAMRVRNHPLAAEKIAEVRAMYGDPIPYFALAQSLGMFPDGELARLLHQWDDYRLNQAASVTIDDAIAGAMGEGPEESRANRPAPLPRPTPQNHKKPRWMRGE